MRFENGENGKWTRNLNRPLTCVCCATRRSPTIWVPANESTGFRLQAIWICFVRLVSHQTQAPLNSDVLTSTKLTFVKRHEGFHLRALSSSNLKCSAIHPLWHRCQSLSTAWGIAKCMHELLKYLSELDVDHLPNQRNYLLIELTSHQMRSTYRVLLVWCHFWHVDLQPNNKIWAYGRSVKQC